MVFGNLILHQIDFLMDTAVMMNTVLLIMLCLCKLVLKQIETKDSRLVDANLAVNIKGCFVCTERLLNHIIAALASFVGMILNHPERVC